MSEQEELLLEELSKRAQPLIERYKKRAQDKKYYDRVKVGMIDLEKAAACTALAAKHLTLSPPDDEHTAQVNLVLSATEALGRDLAEFIQKLEQVSRECDDLARTIGVYTAVTTKAKRGRPTIRYVSETQALMRLFEEVTGKPVVFPKGGGDEMGGAEQVSTEFIRQSLSQIDPTIGTASAITCIRNALKQNAEINRILGEIIPSNPTPQKMD